jgi:hypothetical protein
VTSSNGQAPAWRDVQAALNSIDHPHGKLERIAGRFREVYLHGYSADAVERVRISGLPPGDPTARVALEKQQLRDELARVGAEIVHVAKVLDAADAYFARLCGETRARPREARLRTGEVPVGNGAVVQAGMKELHRRARRGPYAGSMAKKLKGPG